MTAPAAGLSSLAAGGALPPFGPATVLTASQVDLVPLVGCLVVGLIYLYGVSRLRGRGDRWPVGRTLSFVVGGLGTVLFATTSGLATYDDDLFAPHMVQHMILMMVSPVLLALGAPVTLALRTLPASPKRQLLRLLHSRLAAVLTFPLLGWGVYVASPFALYFTGWYAATLDDPLLHELMHVHFLLAGCLFFWPLLGIDPIPGRRSYPLRLLLVGVTLPFHAFLGIAIMSVTPDGASLIAGPHYLALHSLAYVVSQQEMAGALLWASGDLVGLLFLGVMLFQWMRASEREAVREDRRLDRLEVLAQREAEAQARFDALNRRTAATSAADAAPAEPAPAGPAPAEPAPAEPALG